MAPRALGALLALAAAIAFVVSIASSAWWQGHPTVNNQTITAKDVRVGPLGAKGCNTGGDGSCEELETGLESAFNIELGAIGLAVVVAFALTISAYSVGDRRKGLAKLNILVTLIAGGGAGALLALGPDIQAEQAVVVPIGWGTYVLGGAVVSSLLASLITRKVEPEPLRLKPGVPGTVPMTPPPEPFRPQERVSSFASTHPAQNPITALGLGPSPIPPTPAPSDSGAALAQAIDDARHGAPMPMPGDPLGPPVDPFARTAPREGGGEAPPMALPPSRTRPPSAAPPPNRSRPPSASPFPPRSNTPSSPPPSAPRPHSPSSPPPAAARPHSPSSPPPAAARPHSPSSPSPPAARPLSPSTAPPSAVRASAIPATPAPSSRPRVLTPPRVNPIVPAPNRAKGASASPSTPPQEPAKASGPTVQRAATTPMNEPTVRPSAPTLAHSVPPMPTPENTPPPAVLPARDVTAVEIDADAKAEAAAIESTARGTLDPRLAARGTRSATDVATGTHEVADGDVTSIAPVPIDANLAGRGDTGEVLDGVPEPRSVLTGIDIVRAPPQQNTFDVGDVDASDPVIPPPAPDDPHTSATHIGEAPEPERPRGLAFDQPRMTATHIGAVPEPSSVVDSATMFNPASMLDSGPIQDAETGVKISAAPASEAPNILSGSERALSTMQRRVARAPTADPFDDRDGLVPPDGPLSDELASPRSAEIAAALADEGPDSPVTEVHSIPSASELADELAAQSASGSIGEVTGQRRASDLLPSQRESESTPIPTFHGRPSSGMPVSTASSDLPPPRTTTTVTSGPTPACPQCESPMAWVEEHLRFYCKQCRMYF